MRWTGIIAPIALTLAAAGCSDAGIMLRVPGPPMTSTVRVMPNPPVEAGFESLRVETLASVPMRAQTPRPGGRVMAAARQILADLGQGGEMSVEPANAAASVAGGDLDRLQRHVAAAWHFDVDPFVVDVLRVRLRAAIAADGRVHAIELVDSQGGPEEVLARFVEDAIATLDWSAPLPVDTAVTSKRVLMFEFEAKRGTTQ